MFAYFVQAAFLSTASASTVPACVLACAAEAAGYGNSCANLLDFDCIIGTQSSTLESCLSQRCSDVSAANSIFSSLASEYGVNTANSTTTAASSTVASSTSASSSATTTAESSASASVTAEIASSASSVVVSTSSSASPTAYSSSEALTTYEPISTSSAVNTTIPVQTSAATSIPVVNQGAITGNSVAAIAAVAVAAAALL